MAKNYPGVVTPTAVYQFYNNRFSYDSIRKSLKRLKEKKIIKESEIMSSNQRTKDYELTDFGLWYYSQFKNDIIN